MVVIFLEFSVAYNHDHMDSGNSAVFVFKQKCVEALKNGHVKDLPPLNVVEIDSTIGLYEGFQVCLIESNES